MNLVNGKGIWKHKDESMNECQDVFRGLTPPFHTEWFGMFGWREISL